MKPLVALFLLGLLSGCSAPATTASPPTSISASNIVSIDDGIDWSRSLDADVSADELSAGIVAIGDIVPTLEIYATSNNKIGQALMALNIAVLDDPDNAGSKVDDLNDIVDDIEEAIEIGPA